jgi:ABC-type branched-subunit amino acid transport system ATPase component
MLEARGMHARYGRIPALNGVSLSIAAGEAVGVLGHNGMGKTTLLKTLMGYLPLAAGEIKFDGASIGGEPTHRRSRLGLAYVPQGREIFPFLSVRENLALAARAPSDVDAVLADFTVLTPLLGRQGGALSGGQQQILAIARCMATRPKCVLLDEPTEGIQPSIVEAIAALLARLQKSRGLALVIVEQRLDFIASLVGRALVMQKGKIVTEISAEGLADRDAVEKIVGIDN